MARRCRALQRGAPSVPLAAPVAILALLFVRPCGAEVKVTPSVQLSETYSSNPGLQSDAAAHGQFISELSPSLSMVARGPRVQGNLSLSEHLFAYSGSQAGATQRSQFQLQGSAKARLVGDLLFADAAAMIGQQAISAFGAPASTNGYSSANRARISTWSVSPYLVHRFGRSASGELRYSHDAVRSGATGFGDSVGDRVSLALASGNENAGRFGWGINASRQDVETNQVNRVKTREQTASATVSLRANERLRANFTGGYDSYDFTAAGTPTKGASYSVGATWNPSSRTSVDASAGRRYYGNSYMLNASHRSRRTVFVATYSDGITNTRSQLLIPKFIDTVSVLDRLFIADIPDPVARRQAVDAYIRANGLSPTQPDGSYNYLSNRFLLQKQALLSAAFNTSRTTAVLSVNSVRRTALTPATVDSVLLGNSQIGLNDDTRQAGANAALNYRISSRSGVNLTVSRSRVESLSTGIRNNITQASLGMSTQLQRRLKAAIDVRRSQGNAGGIGAPTYHENAITASLSYQP